MRRTIVFVFVCIASLYAVTGYTENSDPRERTELSVTKRHICDFLNEEEFENIADKPCIIYQGGGYLDPLWSIVFRDADTLKVYYRDFKEKMDKSGSHKCSFDTALFLNKYSTILNWGLESLPEVISNEKLEKREYPTMFHDFRFYVVTMDSIYDVPLSMNYKFQHKNVETKVMDLFITMARLTLDDDEKLGYQ